MKKERKTGCRNDWLSKTCRLPRHMTKETLFTWEGNMFYYSCEFSYFVVNN